MTPPATLDSLSGLAGKRALVVGGGLGIGRRVAQLLAAHRTSVCVADVDGQRAEEVAKELSVWCQADALTGDVTEPGCPARLVAEAVRSLGEIEILVNVVGRSAPVDVAAMSHDDSNEMMRLNYLHHVEFGAAFARHRAENQAASGVMTVVSSLAGVLPFPHLAAYGAAKAALNSMVRSMAVEWATKGLRVNAVCPGMCRTDRTQWAADTERHAARSIPLGQLGDQQDIANALVFLSSDLAKFTTGQTLLVDGGTSILHRVWPDQSAAPLAGPQIRERT